jgi:hypothetical protein
MVFIFQYQLPRNIYRIEADQLPRNIELKPTNERRTDGELLCPSDQFIIDFDSALSPASIYPTHIYDSCMISLVQNFSAVTPEGVLVELLDLLKETPSVLLSLLGR